MTVFELAEATLAGRPLKNAGYRTPQQTTLEPGGPRQELHLELKPADDSPLGEAAGDKLKIRLRTSRGTLGTLGRAAVTVTLAPSEPRD